MDKTNSDGLAAAARIDELETRQAFQDDAIATLNEALVAQQQRIGRLEKMLKLLLERWQQQDPEIDLPADEPPPPHY